MRINPGGASVDFAGAQRKETAMSTSEMSEKKDLAPAPAAFDEFTKRFPKLGEAWALMAAAGGEGPLDLKTQRLVKLAVAIGAMREGAVRSAVRKALAAGVEPGAIEQVVSLSASTVGLPSSVAIHTWMKSLLEK